MTTLATLVGIAAVSICLVWLTTPALARDSCATVDVFLTRDVISPGTSVGIQSAVTNCATRKVRYTVVHTHTDACGVTKPLGSYRHSFDPMQSKLIAVSYKIAPDSCPGDGTINVYVKDGEVLLASDSAPLTVVK